MRILYLLLCWVCVADAAMARIGAVVHSDVVQGRKTATWRNQYTLDNDSPRQDHAYRSRLAIDVGITERYAMWAAVEGRHVQGQSMELARFLWDHRFEFTTMQQDGFYSGMRLRYELRPVHTPDVTHVRFIVGKEIGAWDMRLNQIMGAEVGYGRTSGMILDTRFHVAYRYHPDHSFGMESFHQFGNLSQRLPYAAQTHYVGPTFFGAITPEVRYEAGYMAGVSRSAPDHAFYVGFTRGF